MFILGLGLHQHPARSTLSTLSHGLRQLARLERLLAHNSIGIFHTLSPPCHNLFFFVLFKLLLFGAVMGPRIRPVLRQPHMTVCGSRYWHPGLTGKLFSSLPKVVFDFLHLAVYHLHLPLFASATWQGGARASTDVGLTQKNAEGPLPSTLVGPAPNQATMAAKAIR